MTDEEHEARNPPDDPDTGNLWASSSASYAEKIRQEPPRWLGPKPDDRWTRHPASMASVAG